MSELTQQVMDASQFRNPFVVESPEKLTAPQIVALFIEPYTQTHTVKQRRHTFIWGTRGSGKSVMLRYLEPQCQAIVCGGIQTFLDRADSFVAVYCPCKEGHLNKTELGLLSNSSLLVLTEHMLNLVVADRLISVLATQFPDGFFTLDELSEFADGVLGLFDPAAIASSAAKASLAIDRPNNPLKWLQALIYAESSQVSLFLRNNALHGGGAVYAGATTGYHDFLLPLIQTVRGLSGLRQSPVYLLLDDADRLTKPQQGILNTWIANRDQAIVCLKISARRDEYKTFVTRDGGLIEQPHDYSEVDVEELYTRSKSDYAQKVTLIAERRLTLSEVPTKQIGAFLPPDPTETELYEEIRKKTAVEWDSQGRPGRQDDYVYRYATPRLFQYLKARKRRKSYAGFRNMVHLSSGIVRDFLEPCYLMFDKCISKGEEPHTILAIPPATQNEVLYKYSEDFLYPKFDDIRKDMSPDRWGLVRSLRTLMESLGRLFYQRLHDPEAREARLFSFTIRDEVSEDLVQVLELGIRYRYFQVSTYSTKDGGGREVWYILNRRLCPVYKLDPTGFEGRITLTPDALRVACEDTERFVRMRLHVDKELPQLPLFGTEED